MVIYGWEGPTYCIGEVWKYVSLHATYHCIPGVGLPASHLLVSLREEVVTFRSYLPTLHCLLNPLLKLRHWEAIEQATGSGQAIGGGRDTLSIEGLLGRKVGNSI